MFDTANPVLRLPRLLNVTKNTAFETSRVIILDLRHAAATLRKPPLVAHLQRICEVHGCRLKFGCGKVLDGGKPVPDPATANSIVRIRNEQHLKIHGVFVEVSLLCPVDSNALESAAQSVFDELWRQFEQMTKGA
jgi:hypothetical protein